MNPLLALPLALAALAPSLSAAGDAIDFPGPGYREQIDRLSAPLDRIAPVQTRLEPGNVVGQWPRSLPTDVAGGALSEGRISSPGFSFFRLPYVIQTTPAPLVSHITLILEAAGGTDGHDWEAFTPRMVFLQNQIDLSQGAFDLCTWRLRCLIMIPRPPKSWSGIIVQ